MEAVVKKPKKKKKKVVRRKKNAWRSFELTIVIRRR